MAFPTLNNFLQQDASRIVGEIYRIQRAKGIISMLMDRGELPEGQGYNYNTVVYKRSQNTGGNDWQVINQEDGTSNNCVTQPDTINPASTLIPWQAYMRLVQGNTICFEDLRRAYDARAQLSAQQDNFAEQVQTLWENKDNERFFYYSGHKVIANSSLTENVNSPVMPLTPPSTRGIQSILDILYDRIASDGGYEESWPKQNSGPLIPAIMSMQQQRNILKEDDSIRNDIRYGQMGEDSKGWLFQNWGMDHSYGGFMHKINLLQPRYDWTGTAWVERAYYTNVATTIGSEADVSPAYQNAAYEDIYLWHPQVVKRNMPRPMGSYGSKTAFNPVKWNGDVMWINIPNNDPSSSYYNPLENQGNYLAAMQAGWMPVKNQYGFALRVQRCSKFTASACY